MLKIIVRKKINAFDAKVNYAQIFFLEWKHLQLVISSNVKLS